MASILLHKTILPPKSNVLVIVKQVKQGKWTLDKAGDESLVFLLFTLPLPVEGLQHQILSCGMLPSTQIEYFVPMLCQGDKGCSAPKLEGERVGVLSWY